MHNTLIYGLLCIKCVKNTKGVNLQLFVNFWAVANTGRIHGRVFCPCTDCSPPKNAPKLIFWSCNTCNKGHNTYTHSNAQLQHL